MAESVKVWQDWQIVKKLGEGGFGTVYEIMRNRFSIEEHRAMKVIRIPSDPSDVKQVMSMGMDKTTAQDYYRSLVNEFIKEIAFLSELRGASNIVTYDDYKVIETGDGFGWEIYIMMELLTPLPDVLEKEPLSEDEVRKLGEDICDALTLCHSKSILHRDIKADNIFVTREGVYKLGDFGIARTVEKTAAAHTRIGTNAYMAPETYRGQNYDRRADIYSLGILLYRMLNDNRYPFLPPYPKPVTIKERDDALTKRLSGDPLPYPQHGSEALCRAVLKACSFRPEDRYDSAEQMKEALSASSPATDSVSLPLPDTDAYRSVSEARYSGYDENLTHLADDYPPEEHPERRQNVSYYKRDNRDYDYPDAYERERPRRSDHREGERRQRYHEARDDRSSSGLSAGLITIIALIVLVVIGGGITVFALLNRNAGDVTVEVDTSVTEAPTVDATPLSPRKNFVVTVHVRCDFDTGVPLQGYVDGEASGDPEYITMSGPYDFNISATKDTQVVIRIDDREYYSCTLDYDSGEVTNEVYSDDFYSEHIIY